jgi:hypothetical protein
MEEVAKKKCRKGEGGILRKNMRDGEEKEKTHRRGAYDR